MPVGEDAADMGALKLGTYPPVNGTRFMIADYPPSNIPRMHRTETIDYIIVLDGKIDMELDEGRMVTLNKGDVMIQRGTYHAWINRYEENCRMAFVLIDAEPLGIGKPVPRGGIAGDAHSVRCSLSEALKPSWSAKADHPRQGTCSTVGRHSRT